MNKEFKRVHAQANEVEVHINEEKEERIRAWEAELKPIKAGLICKNSSKL
jgi:hypothetical protein